MKEISKYPEIEICDYHNLKHKDFILKMVMCLKKRSANYRTEPPVSYAFCSDTRYLESIVPIIKNVDLLYHEATFLKSHDLKKWQIIQGHTTALKPQNCQKKKFKKLILGHRFF